MSWTGSIQILEQTSERLTVVDPPYYFAGGMFFLVALVGCGFSLIVDRSTEPPTRVGWPAFVVALPFAVIALALLGSQTTVTLDRPGQTMDLTKRRFLVLGTTRREKLTQLRRAVVGEFEGTRTLILEFASGETYPLGSFTDRGGYDAAAGAINRFVGMANLEGR